jgi:uncharacterized protein (UPF0335 family)
LEEDGQSVSELAKTVGYDVRTVKKQTEMAYQEREGREARSLVLRQAVEKHYAGLLSLAEKMDSGIVQSYLPMGIKSDRMWTALHEHLPRSPLWKLIDKMEHLNDEARNIEKRAEQRLWDKVGGESPFNVVSQPGIQEPCLFANALVGQMNYHLHANHPCTLLEFSTSSYNETLVAIHYEGWHCALIPPDQVEKAKEFIASLMGQVSQ